MEPGYLTATFRKIKIEVGLKDLRFHDSRREAATELSKRLSNVLELAAVTGHKSLKILQERNKSFSCFTIILMVFNPSIFL
ncbi:tyrosine-type recombinase/integrase [Entomobacter blattae]|uniref:tyrosine-type recombinase/integrase n=1 Tax=Entomobacter blattae TaxID=2762277 RepID=UPI00308419C2